MSNQQPLPTTYFALSLVAEIHPGDREAIEEAITNILCPFGHFDEPGDPVTNESHSEWPKGDDCRMDWYASTTTNDIEKALEWAVPGGIVEIPNDASALDTP